MNETENIVDEFDGYPLAPEPGLNIEIGSAHFEELRLPLNDSEIAAITTAETTHISRIDGELSALKEDAKQKRDDLTACKKRLADAGQRVRVDGVRVRTYTDWKERREMTVIDTGRLAGRVYSDKPLGLLEQRSITLEETMPDEDALQGVLKALRDDTDAPGYATRLDLQAWCELNETELSAMLAMLIERGMVADDGEYVTISSHWQSVEVHLTREQLNGNDTDDVSNPGTVAEIVERIAADPAYPDLGAVRVTEILHAQLGRETTSVGDKWTLRIYGAGEPEDSGHDQPGPRSSKLASWPPTLAHSQPGHEFPTFTPSDEPEWMPAFRKLREWMIRGNKPRRPATMKGIAARIASPLFVQRLSGEIGTLGTSTQRLHAGLTSLLHSAVDAGYVTRTDATPPRYKLTSKPLPGDDS